MYVECEALPGVAYPRVWDNRSTVNTKTGYDDDDDFFLFSVPSTISRQPAGRFTPNFVSGRTLVPDVSSPLLGVSGPRGAEKRCNVIFVTVRVKGEFFHFGFSAISQQRVDGSTPNFICVGTMSAHVPLHPLGFIGPNGGFVSDLLTHLFFYFF